MSTIRSSKAGIEDCNKKCIDEAARVCREDRKDVQHITAHLFDFVFEAICRTDVESVQIPYFGKFKRKKTRYNAGTLPAQ